MLYELFIKNLVIIEKEHIQFSKGFNVITGETGSGKSLILKALNLILGMRASKDVIGNFDDHTLLEAVFIIDDEQKLKFLESKSIYLEDSKLIITRYISEDSSTIRINSRITTLSLLREISFILMDIYNQNYGNELSEPSNYIKLIDKYNKDKDSEKLLLELNELYEKKRLLNDRLTNLNLDDESVLREIELINYQINEINLLDLDHLDEKKLDEEFSTLNNISDIKENIALSIDKLSSYDYNAISASSLISQIASLLQQIVEYDSRLDNFYKQVLEIEDSINELSSGMDRYIDTLEVDEDRLSVLEEKIGLLFNLKRKYGKDVEEIKKYYKKIESRKKELNNIDNFRRELKKDLVIIETKMQKISERLSSIRKEKAKNLERDLNSSIIELNIKNGQFKVEFAVKPVDRLGIDKIDFLIKTNKGNNFKSLSKSASGGEMSRIMLAFKTIYANYDNIDSLIFDEIDRGISGRSAQVVGEKILSISKSKQIISISHLPQISALADCHFLVRKYDSNAVTVSEVKKISNSDRIEEIARLIGGVNITDKTKSSAKEMLEMALKLKEEK